MRTYFSPEEVRAWGEAELTALIRKYVVVEVPASEWYKEHVPEGGDWEGGSGFVSEAGFRKSPEDPSILIRYVMWDYGMGWQWLQEAEVHISVCDEHGEHRVKFDKNSIRYGDNGDPGAAECLSTLGVRGDPAAREEGTDSGEEKAKTPPAADR